jgi:tripartite-type tricarboxylate transporter receptor subunit TctC
MTRRSHLFSLACIAACAALMPSPAPAQGDIYPSKPIKVIVPFPAGGAADLSIRTLGPKLTEFLGQPIVIDNKPGANGIIIGADAVAKSAPDGYTILFAPREVFGVNPSLYASLPYDPVKSFTHVSIVTEGPYVLVVNPTLGVKTVAELLAVAKNRQLSFGSFGIGSMGHLNLEAFAQAHRHQAAAHPVQGRAGCRPGRGRRGSRACHHDAAGCLGLHS